MGELRAYYCYGYGRSTATGMGVVLLRVWAYYDYGYGRTMTRATGVLRLRLRVNVRAYYVNFFTAYTVYVSYINLSFTLLLGCGSRHVVIQSPRMHLISDSCPLMVNMHHMGNGSFCSVRLHKCEYKQGGFLQA